MAPTAQEAAQEAAGPAARLHANARSFPDKRALVYADGVDEGGAPLYRQKTYRELDEESDAYAAGLHRIGVTPGTKTIMMLRPGPELFTVLFGLFKAGAVPVLVDPGMGVRRMLHCYRTVGAEAFIGVPAAHVLRVLSPRTFASLHTHVTAGKRWFWRGHTLRSLRALARQDTPPAPTPTPTPGDDDLLMIGFTTGSTGPAKGVETTHGGLAATVRQVTRTYGHCPDDVSLLTSPMFGLLDLLAGATCVMPPVDPAKVADADPGALVEAIERFGATVMFASPAVLDRLGRYAAEHGTGLPTLRRLVSGGAPVTEDIVTTWHEVLGGGEHDRFHASYGATEALPISTISSAQTVTRTRKLTREGGGVCVGEPVEGVEVRIVRITDEPMPDWSDESLAGAEEVGEIVVSGPAVSPRYHAADAANAAGKIRDGQRVWHRTGDLGWVDAERRLWFCGRKGQRVRTADGPLYTVQCEQILNAHPEVRRTALVGVGAPSGPQEPVVCVELREGVPAGEKARVERELAELAGGHALTRGLRTFLFHEAFPVDIRHNAKIGREELSVWATSRLRRRGTAGPGRGTGARTAATGGDGRRTPRDDEHSQEKETA